MSLIKKLAEKAMQTLNHRGQDNGYDKKAGTAQEERSAEQIARVFNALTGHDLSTVDAWTFMQVLKLVRMENQIRTGKGDLVDSCNDMISYSLLKAETALQEHRPAAVEEMLAPKVRVAGDPTTQGYGRAKPPTPAAAIATGNHPSLHEVRKGVNKSTDSAD